MEKFRNRKKASIKKQISGRKIMAPIACILMAAVIILGTIASAVINKDEEAYADISWEEIENSTLIIGTHLIHISALNDSLYDIAMESAQTYSQNKMYYKSELADGKWFEISDASNISDIMEEEKAVEMPLNKELNVRYHTKSDGITYDLMTGETVCIFDIINPYSLDTLPELDAIAVYHKSLNENKKKTNTDKRNIELIEAAVSRDLKAELNQENTDEKIAAFQEYYKEASALNKDTKDTALNLMEGLDSERRLQVYRKLYDEILPELLNNVQTDVDDTDGFFVDYGLVSAIGTAMEEVEKKLIKCEAEALKEGTTAIDKVKNDMVNQAAELAAKDGLTEAAEDIDSLMENIQDITNIENGTINNPQREAKLIEELLIPEALKKLSEEDGDASAAAFETEYLARTAVSGMSKAEGADLIDNLAESLNELMEKEDNKNVQEAIKTLNDSILDMKKELSPEPSKLSELVSKKEELKIKRQSSLDVNDLTQAEKIGLEIDEINNEIEKEEQRLTEIISSDTAGEADKAQARAALESGTAADAVISAKESIQKAIADGLYSDGMAGLESMEAFMEINTPLALSSMEDIYDSVLAKIYLEGDKDSSLKEIKETLENIISDNAGVIKDSLSEATAVSILEQIAGAKYEDCGDMEKACICAALYRYGRETRNDEVRTRASRLVSVLYSEGNPYVYLKLKNEADIFIPLRTFSGCSDYRYVFYNESKSVTLARGAKYYTYTVFKNQVSFNQGIEEMDTYARYQSDIYLKEAYMKEKFNVSALYIDATDYGILITKDMEEEISRLLEALYKAIN